MASQSIPILTLTVAASGAVTERRFVGFDGAQIATADVRAMGVARYGVADGKDLPVDVMGTTIVETGGAFAIGDELTVDANGRAVINPEVGGEVVMADALEASAGAGQFVEVFLRR